MFRQAARELGYQGRDRLSLFLYHPAQLAGMLEASWEGRFLPAGERAVRGLSDPFPHLTYPTPSCNFNDGVRARADGDYRGCVVADHLIYAYMIENTRIYEIFRKVLYEYLHGERLEVPSEPGSQEWLRTTEEFFYRDTTPFLITQLTSYIRPDIRASRRNAYYRMFGMDLTHGTDDGRPYPYEKPIAANRDFVTTLEDFLREVWRGIINFSNTSGPNTTDDSAIAEHAERLSDMLTVRRRNGNLSREEFFFVSTMAWFHLTVEFDSPIVKDLKAEATSTSDRLRKIGERVGMPPHVKASDFFSLADRLSRLLIAIEAGTFNDPGNVRPLYAKDSPLRNDVSEIIMSWSSATGRNIKAEPVVPSPATGSASSARALPPAMPPVPASNNSTPPVIPARP